MDGECACARAKAEGSFSVSQLLVSVLVGLLLLYLSEMAGPRGGEFVGCWGEEQGPVRTRRGWGGEDWVGGRGGTMGRPRGNWESRACGVGGEG